MASFAILIGAVFLHLLMPFSHRATQMFAAQVGGLPLGDATGYGILFMICGGMVLASTLPNIFLAYQKWNVRSQARKLVEPTSVETFDHGNRRQEQ